MAKKSMVARERKREKLVAKYAKKREELLEQFRQATNQQEKLDIHRKIQQLPRNSSRTRLRNRCWMTGRSRGYYRDFGLCRNVMREMAHEGLLPGVVKSSW
ncbi:30S ribosomal protein S14 [Halomicronema hongdechloris C2206]|uniref:Small ribosomal subunit protein uS14 n=1 Tax=Halomicronema hongdechloris C2206 TaxID=1641165 RepID=A0A1Z3HUU8_9CYAN|nr:30S ribosomal protein S14 [Halomicronema hongdechloris]ASC74069.1 30S ribosomal protein S14 [Halomicronema hongdechloris C2206]